MLSTPVFTEFISEYCLLEMPYRDIPLAYEMSSTFSLKAPTAPGITSNSVVYTVLNKDVSYLENRQLSISILCGEVCKWMPLSMVRYSTCTRANSNMNMQ